MLIGKRLEHGSVHIIFPPKGVVPLSADEVAAGVPEELSEEFKTLTRLRLVREEFHHGVDTFVWVVDPHDVDMLVGANLLIVLE